MNLRVTENNYYRQNDFNGVKNTRKEAKHTIFASHKKSLALTFGWSKSITKGSVEEKILDVLTDPTNKSAVVATHIHSDGDAYGSNLGVAGILNNLGVKVFSVVDDFPQKQFVKMPSIIEGVPATSFITKPDKVKKNMANAGINQIDLAVFTDCPIPKFTKGFKDKENNVLNLVFDAKKFIIIDHHPDTPGEPPNEEQWKKTLTDLGANPRNILYWREIRPSAAEMVGELDKEIAEENQISPIANYRLIYPGYKIAIAGGMFKDAGGIDNNHGQVKFARVNDKKVPDEKGSLVSVSRQIFDWLIKNCGIPKAKVNMNEVTSLPLPEGYSEKINKIITGELILKGIYVKRPTTKDPLGYIYIENYDAIDKLTDEINKINWKKGLRTKEDEIFSSDIYKEIKETSQLLNRDKNLGLFLLISKFKDKKTHNENLSISVRSYGYNSIQGEMHKNGHIFVDQGAKKVVEALKAAGLGEGAGHGNASGFRTVENVDLIKDILPIVNSVMKESKPTRQVPVDLKDEKVNFMGLKVKDINLFG